MILRILAVFALVAAAAHAQDGTGVRVDVRVTAVSGSYVYLDQGSDAGLAVGDQAIFQPPGRTEAKGLLRMVSKQSARVEVEGGALGFSVGTLGTVWIPSDRVTAQTDVDHPPWEQSAEGWPADLPLLSSAQAAEARGGATTWSGYFFAGMDATFQTKPASNTYMLGNAGLVLEGANFGPWGGTLNLDAEWFYQDADLGNFGSDVDTNLQIEELSYEWGGTRTAPTHFEIGRFNQNGLTEFGLLDGIEVIHRTDSGDSFGFSLGFLPLPDPGLWSEADAEAALFYRWVSGVEEQFALTTGFQQTVHDGTLDRDLFVADLNYQPNEKWFLWSSAWVDFYGPGDDTRSGVELTQLIVNTSYRFDTRTRVGLYANYYRWPELASDYVPPLPNGDVQDSKTTRVGVTGWTDLSEDVDMGARLDWWEDPIQTGLGGELDLTWRGLVAKKLRWDFALFGTDGEYTTVYGGRISAGRVVDAGSWILTYELAQDQNHDFSGSQEFLLQNSLRGSWSFSFGSDWYLSLYADERFGDELQALTVGFDLQKSF